MLARRLSILPPLSAHKRLTANIHTPAFPEIVGNGDGGELSGEKRGSGEEQGQATALIDSLTVWLFTAPPDVFINILVVKNGIHLNVCLRKPKCWQFSVAP